MITLTQLGRRLGAQPYLLLVATTLIWAANAVAGRMAVGEVSPMALTCLRWIIVVLSLAALDGRRYVREWRGIGRAWPRVVAMGALGFTAFNAVFYWSAYHTSAVNMGVIQGVTPALVMLIGFGVFGSRITPLQFGGLLLTLAGVGVVAARGQFAVLTSLDFNIGDLGILLASILYAGYTVALRGRPPLSPLAFFSALATIAFLTSLPLVAAEAAVGQFQWPTARGWAILAFVGLMPSLVAQLLYMRGVEMIGPSRAGLFMNLVPVFAALMGVLILGELFAPYHAVALALVLGGIWLAERGR